MSMAISGFFSVPFSVIETGKHGRGVNSALPPVLPPEHGREAMNVLTMNDDGRGGKKRETGRLISLCSSEKRGKTMMSCGTFPLNM